jgi:hypothetical protein
MRDETGGLRPESRFRHPKKLLLPRLFLHNPRVPGSIPGGVILRLRRREFRLRRASPSCQALPDLGTHCDAGAERPIPRTRSAERPG